jgi:hypothetical protein
VRSPKRVLEIDGSAFEDLDGFYREVSRKLLDPGVFWGHNLDAFKMSSGEDSARPTGSGSSSGRNSERSRSCLGPELFKVLVQIIVGNSPAVWGPGMESGVELELR